MKCIGNSHPSGHGMNGKIYYAGEEAPSVTTNKGEGSKVAIPVVTATAKGYDLCTVGGVDSVNFTAIGSKTRRGRVGRGMANTLDTGCSQGIFVEVSDDLTVYAIWYEPYKCYIAIRKLTPRECYRLQGWDDEYFERSQFVNTDTQLYKTAGNGITVPVVEAIAKRIGRKDNNDRQIQVDSNAADA